MSDYVKRSTPTTLTLMVMIWTLVALWLGVAFVFCVVVFYVVVRLLWSAVVGAATWL